MSSIEVLIISTPTDSSRAGAVLPLRAVISPPVARGVATV